jgi:periplasmic nitrate reductase NapE
LASTADVGRVRESPTGEEASNTDALATAAGPRRSREFFVFLLLAVLIWPFIAVGVVAGCGFAVWMYYLFTGPPGPV